MNVFQDLTSSGPQDLKTYNSGMKTDLAGLELTQLEDFVVSLGHKKFHAKQLYQWVWKRGVTEFSEMTNLSVELRTALAEHAAVSLPRVIQHDI